VNDAQLAREARSATGLSQRAFARLIGAHKGTVAEWESGRGRLSRLTRSLLRLVVTDPGLAMTTLIGPDELGQGERSKVCVCSLSGRVGRAWRSPSPGALRTRGLS
jgi:transcriptional regulator with XRE-family HTH domain